MLLHPTRFKSTCLAVVQLILLSCQPPLHQNEKEQVTSNWEKIGPGGGGSTFIPTFSYATPATFLVRCDMTGSYLTKDGGLSYRQFNFANGASGFAFDPRDANTMYAGSVALHKSTDGGQTWLQLFPRPVEVKATHYEGDHAELRLETSPGSLYPHQAGSRNITSIRVDPNRPERLYFGIDNWFFYTFDGGDSWAREALDGKVDFIYTNPGRLKEEVLIFTSHSTYVFTKYTRTFTRKNLPAAMTPAFSFTGGTLAKGDKVILYALHNDAGGGIAEEYGRTGLWTSSDGGENWQPVRSPLITNEKAGATPSFSRIAAAEFDAAHAYVVCDRYEEKQPGGTSAYWYGALKTSSAGEAWEWVWKGGGGSGQYGVKDGAGVSNLKDAWVETAFGGEYIRLIDAGVSPTDGRIAIVTDWYRTMKTTDGGNTWREVYSAAQPDGTFRSRGMDVTTAYGVHFDPFDRDHLAISYTDIGYHHSYNGGKSWTRSVTGVPAEWQNTCYWVEFDPAVKDKVWSGWSGMHDFPRGKMTRTPLWREKAKGGVCISTDGGKTWRASNEGMGANAPATSLVLDPASPPGNRTLYASVYNKGVFKSTDDGKTWQPKNNGIDSPTGAFEVTIQPDGTLFLVVSLTPLHKDGKAGREISTGAVYKSINGAESWARLAIGPKVGFPNGLGYDPQQPGRLYLACWSSIALSDLVGSAVALSTGGNERLDMEGGIWASEDGGETWKSIFDKKGYVYDVTVDPAHRGRLYCNTFNGAAYRSDDYGKTWKKLDGYDFHWGHRVIVDKHNPEKVYLTTFGSSVWRGTPTAP